MRKIVFTLFFLLCIPLFANAQSYTSQEPYFIAEISDDWQISDSYQDSPTTKGFVGTNKDANFKSIISLGASTLDNEILPNMTIKDLPAKILNDLIENLVTTIKKDYPNAIIQSKTIEQIGDKETALIIAIDNSEDQPTKIVLATFFKYSAVFVGICITQDSTDTHSTQFIDMIKSIKQ